MPGVKATILNAERHQVLGMTGFAAVPQKPVPETPALEVIVELLLHITRQVRALRRQVRLERGIVFPDELVREGALGAVAHIRRRADIRTGLPASRRRQHHRILAKSSCGIGYQAEAVALANSTQKLQVAPPTPPRGASKRLSPLEQLNQSQGRINRLLVQIDAIHGKDLMKSGSD